MLLITPCLVTRETNPQLKVEIKWRVTRVLHTDYPYCSVKVNAPVGIT